MGGIGTLGHGAPGAKCMLSTQSGLAPLGRNSAQPCFTVRTVNRATDGDDKISRAEAAGVSPGGGQGFRRLKIWIQSWSYLMLAAFGCRFSVFRRISAERGKVMNISPLSPAPGAEVRVAGRHFQIERYGLTWSGSWTIEDDNLVVSSTYGSRTTPVERGPDPDLAAQFIMGKTFMRGDRRTLRIAPEENEAGGTSCA
jgi:hypothetical protein